MRTFSRSIRGHGAYLASYLALSAGLTGCGSDNPRRATGDANAGAAVDAQRGGANVGPTWHRDIAPLVAEKCTGCHKRDGIAPFSLENYGSAKPFAERMALAAEAGTMPPFLAQETADCQPKHPWQNDLRLSEDDKQLLRAWADADAPEGDPKTAQASAPPVSTELEREDVIIPLPKEIVIEGERDLHRCVIVDPKLSQDEYVIGRQITAGNSKVLHHVVTHIIDPGVINDNGTMRRRTKAELEQEIIREKGIGIGGSYECFGAPNLNSVATQVLDTWAPGSVPNLAPADAGQPLSKDALVLLDLHYHPTGAPERDATTQIALMLAREKPKYIARSVVIGNFQSITAFISPTGSGGIGDLVQQPDESQAQFLIPAGAEKHVEEMTWKWILPTPVRITAIATHMHYVGRDMRVELEHTAAQAGDERRECLIETPQWDFNWQRGYVYDAPYESLPEARNGDVMKLHCEYDNSKNNPFVVEALQNQRLSSPRVVQLGNDTLDEMCATIINIMYPNPD